jgi:adenosylcobinamide-GDP ribazoletransferase
MTALVTSFVTAWQFLTTVPLGTSASYPTPHDLAKSMAWFPCVGLVLGGILAVSDLLLTLVFPPSVVNVLLMVLLVGLTGGLHLDGLADTVDGLAGGGTATDRLAIMRDARIGALGATALVLALVLRYAGLMTLPQPDRLALLTCLPAAGRWALVVGAFGMPSARKDGGLAQPFLEQLSFRECLGATMVLLVALGLSLGPLRALVACLIVGSVARGVSWMAHRVLGGVTGDTLGASGELAELVFLITAPVVANLGFLPRLAP